MSQVTELGRSHGARCPEADDLPAGFSPWLVGLSGPHSVDQSVLAGDGVLLSAHGGSGASTLTGLCPGLVEVSSWPADGSVPVVVVCRSNAAGLVAAGRLLDDHRDMPALGVVVVADAPGRLPVALARRMRLLEGVAGTVWRVPWVEQWRRRGPAGPPPAGVTRVLERLTAAARAASWS